MGLSHQGYSTDIDRLVKETEEAIANTRRFLDHLLASQEESRKLVQDSLRVLEINLSRLNAKRDKAVSEFDSSGDDQQK